MMTRGKSTVNVAPASYGREDAICAGNEDVKIRQEKEDKDEGEEKEEKNDNDHFP